MEIAGGVIVVTGASSGIGRATALLLAEQGAHTVLVARRAAELDAVAAECDRRAGFAGSALPVAADVTDSAAVEDVAARAVERFGRIDGWVNSAGVTGFGALLDVPLSDIERILRVNVMGTVHGARAALPRMIEQGSGVLVNLSSLLGVVAPPLAGHYAMTKSAVRSLGGSLREELRLAGARVAYAANQHIGLVFAHAGPFFDPEDHFTKALPQRFFEWRGHRHRDECFIRFDAGPAHVRAASFDQLAA